MTQAPLSFLPNISQSHLDSLIEKITFTESMFGSTECRMDLKSGYTISCEVYKAELRSMDSSVIAKLSESLPEDMDEISIPEAAAFMKALGRLKDLEQYHIKSTLSEKQALDKEVAESHDHWLKDKLTLSVMAALLRKLAAATRRSNTSYASKLAVEAEKFLEENELVPVNGCNTNSKENL